jgi:hypothetical protein
MRRFRLCRSINRREQFGLLLNDAGLTGEAAEIGTHVGKFAWHILSRWTGRLLHCVDPWTHYEGYHDPPITKERDRDADFAECQKRLAPFESLGRVKYHREFSVPASKWFADNSLDFVYIDAAHDAASVRADMQAWWPKVRIGGIMAGHDLTGVWRHEIRPVVDEFFGDYRYFVVRGDAVDQYPPFGDAASWFARKS